MTPTQLHPAPPESDTSRAELCRIAEDAYLFGFPLVLTETTRRIATNVPDGVRPGFGPMNRFSHLREFPPGDFREVIRPNFDTLYSILWFDVTAEPLVISVPDTAGRYYLLPFLDMWTDVFAVIGRRTTGTSPGEFALVGRGWSGDLPEGMDRIEAPTPQGWVIGRTQTNGPADYPAVHRIQDGFVATTLSVWRGAEDVAPPTETDPTIDLVTAPLDQTLALTGAELLRRTADLMRRHPPHLVDQPVVARMRRLGLVVGRPFAPDTLAPDLQDVLEEGAASARERMSRLTSMHPIVDGWSLPTFGMGAYATDYWRRAVVAKVGLGANLVEDAVYPVLLRDGAGDTPVGELDYVLHFEADALPPVNAFWSVTMYDGDGFPVPNELERYSLGDRDPLRRNPDGSLDIHIRRDDPGEARRANWLPSPAGPLGITMRLYDPDTRVLDGTWTPPPLVRA